MKRTIIFLLTFGLIAILAVSCSDRGTNSVAPLSIQEGGINMMGGEGEQVFADYFSLQIENEFAQIAMKAYQPRVTFPQINGGSLTPVPVVILLAPQDGGAYYYFDHGLKEIADELIASGEIQPMIIVCVANDRFFGGYFYANNYPAAGSYDDFISDWLIDSMYTRLISPMDPTVKKPAIGGIGMGAYGAMRAVILHPDKFSAISIADGPLDFDGSTGNGGFKTLFDDVMTEQSLLNDPNWRTSFSYDGTKHLSRLFTSAAYSFSPEDTAVDYTVTIRDNLGTIIPGDSIREVTIDARYQLSELVDSTSLIQSVISSPSLFFHLPFDNTGAIRNEVWDWWIDDNLENLMTPNVLSGKNIWIAHSDGFTFANYGEQTAAFIAHLQSEGYPVTVYPYYATGNKPVDQEQHVYDLIREMLIFQSESFGD